MGGGEAGAVDLSSLRALQGLSPETEFRGLLQAFDDTVRDYLGRLEAALPQRDRLAVQKAAHTLNGTLGGMGAVAAEAVADRLERRCRDADWDEIAALSRQLSDEAAAAARTIAAAFS